MEKRVLLIFLSIALLACCTTAYATEARSASGQANLTFDDATAICTYSISSPGKVICVNMELWHGSVLVDSWNKTGTHAVSLNESCPVTRGLTYTLKVSGTCGGETISPTSVTKTCRRI